MSGDAVIYINRATGRREPEIVYGESELRFLYQTRLGGLFRRIIVTKTWFSALNAWPKRSCRSKKAIARFAHRYGVDIAEAEKPLHEYRSLDDFFTRRLKPGVRTVCNDEMNLVSPADGRALVYRISDDAVLHIKDQKVKLSELLRSEQAVHDLRGGSAMVIRLAPKDYHRFHFPAAGLASAPFCITGPLESVHRIALDTGARSFLNKRTLTTLTTKRFGRLYCVDVGALTVGTIVQSYRPGWVEKGQEKGYFRFGGSTVILLWGRDGPVPDQDLVDNSRHAIETLVKMGTRIARSSQSPSTGTTGSQFQ